MLRKSDTDSAAIVDRDPGRSGGGIHQRVQQWPIGNGIAAIDHSFCLAVRRSHRTGVQMIPADYNWRLNFAALYQLVHGQTEFGALPVAEPTNASRQSLKVNPLLGQLHPAR